MRFAISLLTLIASCHVCGTCIPNLFAQWTFDEMGGTVARDTTDPSSRGLTIPAEFTFNTLGNPQGLSALKLTEGSDKFGKLPGMIRPQQLTCTFWFKTSVSSGSMAVASWSNGGSHNIKLMLNQGHVQYLVSNNIFPTSKVKTAKNYADGKWHFAALTHDEVSKKVQLFIPDNGAVVSVLNVSLGETVADNYFRLGGFKTGSEAHLYSGELDDFRLYKSVLTVSEITSIFNRFDKPCKVNSNLYARSAVNLTADPHTALTFKLDITDAGVCAPLGVSGACQNNRYGVAIEVCRGSLAGVAFSAPGSQDKISSPLSAACALAYQRSAYSVDELSATRLCSAVTNNVMAKPADTNPLASAAEGIITVATGARRSEFQLRAVVANQSRWSPASSLTVQFQPNAGFNHSCQDNKLTYARWDTPTLSDGSTCTDCSYQLWYASVYDIATTLANLNTTCGLKGVGQQHGVSFTTPTELRDVQLAPTVNRNFYHFAIFASSPSTGAQGVVAVFDKCNHDHIPIETDPPTPLSPKNVTPSDKYTEPIDVAVKLNKEYSDYPYGSAKRSKLVTDLLTHLALTIKTDRFRLSLVGISPGSIIATVRINKPPVQVEDGERCNTEEHIICKPGSTCTDVADKTAFAVCKQGGSGSAPRPDSRDAFELATELKKAIQDTKSQLHTAPSAEELHIDAAYFKTEFKNISIIPVAAPTPEAVDSEKELLTILTALFGGLLFLLMIGTFLLYKSHAKERRRSSLTQSFDQLPGTQMTAIKTDKPKNVASNNSNQQTPSMQQSNRAQTASRPNTATKQPQQTPSSQYSNAPLNQSNASSAAPAAGDYPVGWYMCAKAANNPKSLQKGDILFKRGDWVQLLHDSQNASSNTHWSMARNLRTKEEGYVPKNHFTSLTETPPDLNDLPH
mmetsp:Transcript_14904/g.29235  ORF Transcript_14904/g.29235 Transcript_14904/m.29235 type:complete len:909 (-) Transcript_14904:50-2776(-)